jgi:restriction system protein
MKKPPSRSSILSAAMHLAAPPQFFEHLVAQLLVAMGYGGKRANAGQVTQQSADNGIDGIINEDPLGLDTIYLQAKRWQDPVGVGPIRDFIGPLVIKGVKKGVFLTTSYFTTAARAAVQGINSNAAQSNPQSQTSPPNPCQTPL